MSELVIRQVTPGVWTFSRPFARFGIWPIGGRTTAVQLKAGGTWLCASTPLDTETRTKLDEMGPVKYIIGADDVHYMFLADYKKAFPNAKLIATPGAVKTLKDKGVSFDGVFGSDPPNTTYGFEEEIKHCYFSGFRNKDVAFFHPESKSLIEADLLMNLPCNEQYSKSKTPNKLFGIGGFGPYSGLHSRLTWSLGSDTEAMKRDARTVDGWDFERIIPCHGDVIETDAKKAWRSAFKHFLN